MQTEDSSPVCLDSQSSSTDTSEQSPMDPHFLLDIFTLCSVAFLIGILILTKALKRRRLALSHQTKGIQTANPILNLDDSINRLTLTESLQTSLDNSNASQNLSDERFVEVKAFPGGQGDVFGVPEGVLECPEVFWGCWRVYGRLKGMSCSLFPSISFNLRKSQMKSVTFLSRPRGTKCRKYQNVPM